MNDVEVNQNHRADKVRTKARVYRRKASEIEFWDLMCYARNAHIAVVDQVNQAGNAVDSFAVCQSAGRGPCMNDFRFLPADDIGHEFCVISSW